MAGKKAVAGASQCSEKQRSAQANARTAELRHLCHTSQAPSHHAACARLFSPMQHAGCASCPASLSNPLPWSASRSTANMRPAVQSCD
eukprot:235178-Chlamydomonas_euryale.AAC.7